jgi:hypothetical protein
VDVPLAGDARATLAALLPRSADHSFPALRGMVDW